LSKAYLKGEGAGQPDVPPDKFYREQKIDLIADRAAAIDRGAQALARIRLVARLRASGAGHRRAQPPARSSQCQSRRRALLRILDESEALRQRIASVSAVVVIGAGFIGLEFAATCPGQGP
jgi:3-phenylpropionate/trans-cinnamate dioxygenase ferredoxin reductase subunit